MWVEGIAPKFPRKIPKGYRVTWPHWVMISVAMIPILFSWKCLRKGNNVLIVRWMRCHTGVSKTLCKLRCAHFFLEKVALIVRKTEYLKESTGYRLTISITCLAVYPTGVEMVIRPSIKNPWFVLWSRVARFVTELTWYSSLLVTELVFFSGSSLLCFFLYFL